MKRLQLFILMLMALPIGMLAAGTSWQTATLIENGATGKGSLSSDVKEQWHKIVVPENGVIKLTVTPASGLSLSYFRLFSVVSNETHERNYIYIGGSSQKVLEVKDVAAGTYYIKTDRNSGEGSFTIKYSFTATSSSYPNDKEVNDTYDKASELKLGTNTTGQLGYYYWDDCDTKDYHKIVVPENGTLQLTLAPNSGLTISYMRLYTLQDGELNERNYIYFGGSDTKTLEVVDVAPGTYYIMVERNGGQGGYRLTYGFSYQKALYPNDNEPNDTYDKATELKNGTSTTGQLGYYYWDDRDTKDYHKIVVSENGTIQLTLAPQTDKLSISYMTLYALKDGELKQRNYIYFGNSEEKTLEVTDIAAGTYYILVERNGGQGGYTLSYNFTPLSAQYPNDNEPNDSYDKASFVKRGNTITGQLGHYYWDDRDTKDYHKIEVPRDGTIKLTLAPKEGLTISYMTLYALKDGELNQRNYTYFGNGETKTLEVADVAPGTYYILVERNSGQGGYTLQYIFEQNPYATDVEPNDTYDKAISLAKGNTVAGHLGYFYCDDTDKKDWYKINLASKGNITLTAKPYGTLSFSYITLYASNGTSSKGYVYFGNSDQKQLTVENLDAGTYYILVERNGGNGYYFLAYASTIGSVEKQEELPDELSGTITLNKTEAILEKTKTMTLKATVSSGIADQSVTWTSSNTAVATVSSTGKVKGVKAGFATITCTSKATGESATCQVTVGYVKLDKTEAILEKTKTMTLTATVYPSALEDRSVTWKSSNTAVATVSSKGKVTGVKAGTAVITCTSKATGLSTTCTVTVGYVKLDQTEAILEKTKTMTLTPTVYPSALEDKSVTWKSSDTKIATVSSNGEVTGVKAGFVTITCTSNATGLSTSCAITVGYVKLDKTEAILEKTKTMTLTATVYPSALEDRSVTWKSSDTKIATVSSNGEVTGVKAGFVTITCTSNATGLSTSCAITVGYVKLDKTEAILEKTKTMTLTATVYPSALEDRSVTWKSSNTAVATVSSSGKVKGVKAGTAVITCTSNATGLSTTCTVTVGYVKLDKTEFILKKGKTTTLTATVYPSALEDRSVTWKSSNTAVATVSSSGKVKGVKSGTAIITCTSNATGLSTTCTVTVGTVILNISGITLNKDNTITLKAAVYPETLEDKSVTWKSSDETIATVTSAGKVKGIAAGTATITCTSVATGLSATCTVTVTEFAPARTLLGDDAEVTGIETVDENPAIEEPFDVYDLSGRKVLHQVISLDGLPAGVYIVNGKKVMKK